MVVRIITADVMDGLAQLDDESVHCVVTSPPYWGLRDYGATGQLGLEPTLDGHVAAMVRVFREVNRVLRKDGTLWLNYGDSYAPFSGLKPKDLCGTPWRIAFALQTDGWWLRQDIIWSKPNPMPESVRDRCTKAHEYLFLMAKNGRYYFDAEAIAENAAGGRVAFYGHGIKGADRSRQDGDRCDQTIVVNRNKRSVWEIPNQPFSGAHFAAFPPALVQPCIMAGCPIGGMVLDPFGGSGTTGLVADRLNRNAILIELNPEYAAMADKRIKGDCPMFANVV